MQRLLIDEPSGSGHRLYYVRLICETALAAGIQPILLTSSATLQSDAFAAQLGGLLSTGAIRCVELHESDATRLGRVSAIYRTVRAEKPTWVVIPDADKLLPAWVLARVLLRKRLAPDASLVLLRPPLSDQAHGRRGLLVCVSKAALARILRRLSRRDTLFALTGQASQPNFFPGFLGAGVRLLRDPAQSRFSHADRNKHRSELGLQQNATWIGVIGAVTRRKHPSLVADAVMRIRERDPHAKLLIAGELDEQIREWARTSDVAVRLGDALLVRHQYFSEEEFDRLVAACSCIVLAYDHEGPSGLLAKSTLSGTPLVVAGSHYLAREVQATGWGVATALSADALADGVLRALTQSRTETRPLDSARSRAAHFQDLIADAEASELSTGRLRDSAR